MKKTDPKKTQAAGYVRVSSEHQADEDKSSLEIQKEAIQKYAKDNNMTIYEVYEDHETGKKADRTNYGRMKEDGQAGHFKKVIFHKWDRFGRDTREILKAHDELKEIGVDIICIAQNIDTSTGHGRFFMTAMAAIAELEREQIKERVIGGLKDRARKNLKIGSAAFGYSWNEEKRQFEVNPKEAEVYKLMVSLYLDKGLSTNQIARYLIDKGLKSRKVKSFSKGRNFLQSSIAKILKNPVYLGKFRYTFQGEDHEIDLPPLIDRKRWDLIQRKIKENFHSSTRSRNYPKNDPFILRDLLTCGECHHGVMALNKHRKGRIDRYYTCFLAQAVKGVRETLNRKEGQPKDCDLPYIPAERLEEQIKGLIHSYFMFPETLIKRWKEQTATLDKASLESKLMGDRSRLGKLKSKRQEYYDMFNDGDFDRDELKQQDGLLRGQIEKLQETISDNEKQLSEIEGKEEDLKRLTETVSQIEALRPQINKAIAKLTNEQWKQLIRTGLEGERLTVSILRRSDLVDNVKGMTPAQLYEPVTREARGGKVIDWKLEGDWNLSIERIAQYLQPLIELSKGM